MTPPPYFYGLSASGFTSDFFCPIRISHLFRSGCLPSFLCSLRLPSSSSLMVLVTPHLSAFVPVFFASMLCSRSLLSIRTFLYAFSSFLVYPPRPRWSPLPPSGLLLLTAIFFTTHVSLPLLSSHRPISPVAPPSTAPGDSVSAFRCGPRYTSRLRPHSHCFCRSGAPHLSSSSLTSPVFLLAGFVVVCGTPLSPCTLLPACSPSYVAGLWPLAVLRGLRRVVFLFRLRLSSVFVRTVSFIPSSLRLYSLL